jgi:hypothetical protein
MVIRGDPDNLATRIAVRDVIEDVELFHHFFLLVEDLGL